MGVLSRPEHRGNQGESNPGVPRKEPRVLSGTGLFGVLLPLSVR